MCKEGPKNKTVEVENAETVYNEEKNRRISLRASMTKNIKRLEGSIQEFSELKVLDLPDGDFNGNGRKYCYRQATYSKMETLNESLVNKLILVDRVSKVEDLEKAVDDLNGALETYYEKWIRVKTGPTAIFWHFGAFFMPPSNNVEPHIELRGSLLTMKKKKFQIFFL